MNNRPTTTTINIEILGKPYTVRCAETEVKSLQEAAAFLNRKMLEVQESGKAINLERIAIITALNITHQFLQMDHQQNNLLGKINQKIAYLQDILDTTLAQNSQAELLYTTD